MKSLALFRKYYKEKKNYSEIYSKHHAHFKNLTLGNSNMICILAMFRAKNPPNYNKKNLAMYRAKNLAMFRAKNPPKFNKENLAMFKAKNLSNLIHKITNQFTNKKFNNQNENNRSSCIRKVLLNLLTSFFKLLFSALRVFISRRRI